MGLEKLVKSLDEIDAMADEVIAKSLEADEDDEKEAEDDEVEKGLKPDEVAKDEEGAPEDDADDEDADDEEDDEDDAEEEEDEDTKKSFVDELLEDEVVSKSVEVSEFLGSFTRMNGAAIDEMREDVQKSLDTSVHTATVLAKSFNAIMKSQNGLMDIVKSQSEQLASQNEIIKSLQDRIDGVERQPVQRKAVVNTVEKSFNHSAGLANAGEAAPLSKSEKLSLLTNMAMEGKNGVTINDVVSYESTGHLRPELESVLKDK